MFLGRSLGNENKRVWERGLFNNTYYQPAKRNIQATSLLLTGPTLAVKLLLVKLHALMNISTDQLVQQIHDARTRIVLSATGGGSRAIADLLEVPGASRTLLEAFVPYSAEAMIDYLGSRPDEFCSQRTARAIGHGRFSPSAQIGSCESGGGRPCGRSCRRGMYGRIGYRSATTRGTPRPCGFADSFV